jgi:hypothetical protein
MELDAAGVHVPTTPRHTHAYARATHLPLLLPEQADAAPAALCADEHLGARQAGSDLQQRVADAGLARPLLRSTARWRRQGHAHVQGTHVRAQAWCTHAGPAQSCAAEPR